MNQAANQMILAAWLGWVALWAVWSRGTKRVIRRESLWSRALHLGPLLVAVLLLIDPRDLPSALDAALLPPAFWLGPVSLVVTLAGLGFAIWARVTIAGNWSGTVTLKQDHELVRGGPYAWVRHPIYTGLILALTGTAIATDAWRGWIAVAVVTASFLRKLRTEEAFMREAFGAAYDAYAQSVPALVPGAK
jgi:protein-S-isoprenylcysteine O-methyltransferase Ste14